MDGGRLRRSKEKSFWRSKSIRWQLVFISALLIAILTTAIGIHGINSINNGLESSRQE